MVGKHERVMHTFFTFGNNINIWRCKCGTKRLKRGTGWANLIPQMQKAHWQFYGLAMDSASSTEVSLEMTFVNEKADAGHWSRQWVVHEPQTFKVVEKKTFWQIAILKPISTETPLVHGDKPTFDVEIKIVVVLSDRFDFVFDGWKHQSAHFVGIFAFSHEMPIMNTTLHC